MATQQQLTEAEAALHKLLLGRQVVSVTIDGVETNYTQADLKALRQYVQSLKIELGVSGHGRVPPARVT
jgi:hypothetical protein